MKNHFKNIFILMLAGLLLGACSKQKSSSGNESEEKKIDSGACGVSYFPILPNKTWTYRMIQDNELYAEDKVWYENITDDSFVWKQQIDSDPPITSEVNWTCSADGMISTDYASTDLVMIMQKMGYDSDYQIKTLDFSGITFPADDKWFVGSEWTSSWKVESDVNVEDLGLVHLVIDVTMNNVIGAEEPVTVPLRSYDKAMRVDSTMQLAISMEAKSITMPTVNEDYVITSWYVQGVGMVKQVSEDTNFSMELASLE